jgi:hypothetical protein
MRNTWSGVRRLSSFATGACCPRSPPGCVYFVEPLGGRGDGADPPRPSWIPIEVEGGLISCGGKGLGVMDLYSTPNAASHEIVCAIIRIPTAPDSHDISRTLRAFSSRSA